MFIASVVDIQTLGPSVNIQTLLLSLDYSIDVPLPNGYQCIGVLREVNPIGSNRMVELVIEIDDELETLFYIDHNADHYKIVQRN